MKNDPHSQLPGAEEVKDFLAGRLSKARSKEVEQALADSPWGDDALEGWSLDPELKGMKGVKIGKGGWTIMQYMSVILPVLLVGAGIWYFTQGAPDESIVDQPNTTTIPMTPKAEEAAAQHVNTDEESIQGELPLVVEASSTDSSFSFTVEATDNTTAVADEEPEELFLEVERIATPEALLPREIDGKTLPVEALDDSKKLAKTAHKVYHIRDYKVVDYRGIRQGNLSLDDLSNTGSPAGETVEEILFDHLLEADRMKHSVAYVDWLEYSMIAFAQERYTRAIRRFNVILIDYPDDANALFYKGMAHYYSQEYDKAERLLNRSFQGMIKTFAEESLFYRAESLQELGRSEEARVLYDQIASEEGYYADRALARLN